MASWTPQAGKTRPVTAIPRALQAPHLPTNTLLTTTITLLAHVTRSESPVTVTEATDTDVTGETAGDVLILTTTTPPPSPSPAPADVVLTLPDSSDQIKPQNIEKCDKCLKLTFRYRHPGFCGKCLTNNYIDPEEQQQLGEAQHCSKCRKTKFRSRYQLFCATECSAEDEVKPSVQTELPDLAEPQSTFRGEPMSHKRALKMKARAERRKERENRRMEKKKKKSSPDVAQLGPLGSILRAIIQANTWT